MAFSGGNPWKEIGSWGASGPSNGLNGTIVGLNNLGLYLGLKNSDDEATRFDFRAEVYKNGALETVGETRCVIGLTRNPDRATLVIVPLGGFPRDNFTNADQVSVRVLTRIGTTVAGAICGSHASAGGARLYFDAARTPSGFQAAFGP